MYDNCMIVAEEFMNISCGNNITGFQIGIRLPYYRGIVLSLLGETTLQVDGEGIPVEKMTLTINGKTLPLKDVEHEPVHRWEFGDTGILFIEKEGGLPSGKHEIFYRQHVHVPYIPGGIKGEDTKEVSVLN